MKDSAQRCLTPLGKENSIKKSNIKMKIEKIQWKNQKWIPACAGMTNGRKIPPAQGCVKRTGNPPTTGVGAI